MNLAAAVLIYSSLFRFVCVSCVQPCMFLLKKSGVLLDLCCMLSMCVLKFMLACSVMVCWVVVVSGLSKTKIEWVIVNG